jgi:hypothetical protein
MQAYLQRICALYKYFYTEKNFESQVKTEQYKLNIFQQLAVNVSFTADSSSIIHVISIVVCWTHWTMDTEVPVKEQKFVYILYSMLRSAYYICDYFSFKWDTYVYSMKVW